MEISSFVVCGCGVMDAFSIEEAHRLRLSRHCLSELSAGRLACPDGGDIRGVDVDAVEETGEQRLAVLRFEVSDVATEYCTIALQRQGLVIPVVLAVIDELDARLH